MLSEMEGGDLLVRQERATGSNTLGRSCCWKEIMTYDGFNDNQKGPVLLDAEIGRAVLGFSISVYPEEVLPVFPPQGVHLSRAFKRD